MGTATLAVSTTVAMSSVMVGFDAGNDVAGYPYCGTADDVKPSYSLVVMGGKVDGGDDMGAEHNKAPRYKVLFSIFFLQGGEPSQHRRLTWSIPLS